MIPADYCPSFAGSFRLCIHALLCYLRRNINHCWEEAGNRCEVKHNPLNGFRRRKRTRSELFNWITRDIQQNYVFNRPSLVPDTVCSSREPCFIKMCYFFIDFVKGSWFENNFHYLMKFPNTSPAAGSHKSIKNINIFVFLNLVSINFYFYLHNNKLQDDSGCFSSSLAGPVLRRTRFYNPLQAVVPPRPTNRDRRTLRMTSMDLWMFSWTINSIYCTVVKKGVVDKWLVNMLF